MTVSSSSVELLTPVQFIKGVGPERAELLIRMGLRTATDLLFAFPRSYEFPSATVAIADLKDSQPATVLGRIVEMDHRVTASGRSILGVLIQDESAPLRLIFFNQAFRLQQFHRGMRLLAAVEPKQTGVWMEAVHPRVVMLGPDETPPAGRPLPVYALTEGLKQSHMRKILGGLIEPLASQVPEVLPETVRKQLQVLPIQDALRLIHQPENETTLAEARRRFVLQELLVLQLALALRRRELTTNLRAPELPPEPEIDARIRKRFSFRLTGDQDKACREVGADMARQFPMNRLLQGDVGSGKTVIAQYALLLAVAHRHQAVLMAPTEVLVRQHYETLQRALAGSRVRIGMLSGGQTAVQRRETLEAAIHGTVDVLVGTQSLLHEQVKLPRLGLVIIDEQHKFGVAQRAALRADNVDPHCLVLSATPIPRTLAMTMLADLDVSTLREKPPGRGEVHTYLAKDGWRQKWWQFVSDRVAEGRQAFIVAPRIGSGSESFTASTETAEATAEELDEDSETAVSTVHKIFEELHTGPLAHLRIDLLHGRMSAEEKQLALEKFAQGRTQVLVSTSVIEVGIDVPNATIMTIFGAERFGLAQLHQLRGRVSRGKHPGYVCLFTDGNESAEEVERLRVLAATNDGFELAEADFRLRGPGELLGLRQSGMPPLRIADLLRDQAECLIARELALDIVDQDPVLSAPELERLRSQVLRRYGEALKLGNIA